MTEFKVNIPQINAAAHELQGLEKTMHRTNMEILSLAARTTLDPRTGLMIKSSMLKIAAQSLMISGKMQNLSTVLFMSKQRYITIENGILSSSNRFAISVDSLGVIMNRMNTDVFDPSSSARGKYGGDQGGPQSVTDPIELRAYMDIIFGNTGHRFRNEDELKRYLRHLNSEGCGYVAHMNLIFRHFENDPDGFQRTFGYPLRDQNGDYNYNRLLVDFYSATDDRGYEDYNANTDGSRDSYNYWDDVTGHGLNGTTASQRFSDFMNAHGISVNERQVNSLTQEEYTRLVNSGHAVVIRSGASTLHSTGGYRDQSYNGGHQMTITGITSEGNWIVSSWGKEYVFNPNESEVRAFLIVGIE